MRPRGPVSLLVVTAIAMAVASCSRSPAEPAPTRGPDTAPPTLPMTATPATAAASATTTAPSKPACVVPLASVAPAIPPPAAADCPVDPEMGGPKLGVADVTFPDASGKPRVTAELAKTPHDIERGLMYRRAMPDDRGMLFRLDGRKVHMFWMHNTCISLDMMFVDDDGTIVGIAEAAHPLDDSTESVPCPSSWVLEVNAGWSRKHGVAPGQKMTIPAAAR